MCGDWEREYDDLPAPVRWRAPTLLPDSGENKVVAFKSPLLINRVEQKPAHQEG